MLVLALAGTPDGGVAAPANPVVDTTLERYKSPIEALTEHPVGETSRAVRFDWRRSRIGFGVIGGSVIELNNFSSARIGGYVRKAFGNIMIDAAVSYVDTWGSLATDQLSRTPYRQFARPRRAEFEVNFGYAIAEGVVTSRPGMLPAAQLVLTANAGVRYVFYPGGVKGLPFFESLGAVFSPRISDAEVLNLESSRLPGMQIDRARYAVLAGLTLDVYFKPGFVLTPRVMMALPVFSAIQGAQLGAWWELSIAAGVSL